MNNCKIKIPSKLPYFFHFCGGGGGLKIKINELPITIVNDDKFYIGNKKMLPYFGINRKDVTVENL